MKLPILIILVFLSLPTHSQHKIWDGYEYVQAEKYRTISLDSEVKINFKTKHPDGSNRHMEGTKLYQSFLSVGDTVVTKFDGKSVHFYEEKGKTIDGFLFSSERLGSYDYLQGHMLYLLGCRIKGLKGDSLRLECNAELSKYEGKQWNLVSSKKTEVLFPFALIDGFLLKKE